MPKRKRRRKPPRIKVPLVDAVECMVPTLSRAQEDMLLCSTVNGPYVGPGDCHLLSGPHRALPSDELLFYVARRCRATVILFGSRAYGSIAELDGADLDLCRRLLRAAKRNGIHVIDHVVVTGGMFRSMSESTDLWAPGTGLMN